MMPKPKPKKSLKELAKTSRQRDKASPRHLKNQAALAPKKSKPRREIKIRMSTLSPNSPELEFFLVSLPGLEDLLLHEIKEWFPGIKTTPQYGGVSVHTDMANGLAMNQVLKIPTRILLRLAKFRARDFPKLYHYICEFDWEKWLSLECDLEVVAATKLSRLKIKSRIEETCLEGWQAVQQTSGHRADPAKKARLFVRIIEDEVTLSLDTSGERLHKRGSRQHIGEAPLRETIAAALLQMVAQTLPNGDTRPVELLDPMMGSGTFLLEAAQRDQTIDAREFGFDCFALNETARPTLQAARPQFANGLGFERDHKALAAAKANLKGSESLLPYELRNQDFFASTPLAPAANRSRWVMVNPPYGERLKVTKPLPDFYAELFATTERVARPDRACFLIPAKAVHGKFALPAQWKVLAKRRFLNGGIPVVAFVFGREATTGT